MRAAIWMMCPYRPQKNYLASDDKSGSRVTGNHFCLYFFLVLFFPYVLVSQFFSKRLRKTRNFHAVKRKLVLAVEASFKNDFFLK